VNSAKENKLPYAILHIIDKEPVDCQVVPLALDKKNYICQFKKIVKTTIKTKKLRLVDIEFLEKKKEFYIKITPKVDSRLVPVNETLYNTKEVSNEVENTDTKHWVILLYEKPPFGKKVQNDGINFPIRYNHFLKPHIGPVDLNGAPISYARSKDVNYYLDIQKEFKKGDYEGVVKDVDKVLKLYPNSIFKSDLLLYKLQVIDESIEKNLPPVSNNYTNTDVANLGKAWIREFSSNENIPQVLLILVKDYLRSGSNSDVNYFLDILVTEHQDSIFTKRAILYFADSLFAKNQKDKAIKLYQDVLYSVKDMDVASQAAIKLTKSSISIGKILEAKKYLLKVLNANKNYLLKNKISSHALSTNLAANGLYGVAAVINDLLYANTNKNDRDTRELLLKESGDWYAKVDEINKAYARYKEYKTLFKDGLYIDEVNKALDRLFFKLNETNTTKLSKYYDVLISKYSNDIKDKAVIEKTKLLLKEKKYNQVLKMQDMLETAVDKNSSVAKDLLNSAATVLLAKDLKNKDCNKVVYLVEKYKLDIFSVDDEDNLYKCFLINARYKKAKMLAKSKIASKSMLQNFKWLQKEIEVDLKLRKFDEIIKLKNDLFKLSRLVKRPIFAKSYRYIFDSYFAKKQYNKALGILDRLDRNAPNDVKNMDSYYKVVGYANDNRDDLLLIKYAKKIINMQEKNKLFLFTPKIEFAYIGALKRLTKYTKAYKIAVNLNSKSLKNRYKSRVLYQLGELSMKLKNAKNAKKYFTKCSSLKAEDSWSSLCKESSKLF
jgi:hypothetical protein